MGNLNFWTSQIKFSVKVVRSLHGKGTNGVMTKPIPLVVILMVETVVEPMS